MTNAVDEVPDAVAGEAVDVGFGGSLVFLSSLFSSGKSGVER